MVLSRAARWAEISSAIAVGADPVTRYSLHASVVMMKPGGTGRPRLVISARLAPLPPSRSLRSLLPSVKSYTNFGIERLLALVSSPGRGLYPAHRSEERRV